MYGFFDLHCTQNVKYTTQTNRKNPRKINFIIFLQKCDKLINRVLQHFFVKVKSTTMTNMNCPAVYAITAPNDTYHNESKKNKASTSLFVATDYTGYPVSKTQ